MLRITDRYVLREVVPPFLLALLVLTFVLMLPPLMNQAEELIAKGVDGITIARMMLMLAPQGRGSGHPDGAADRHPDGARPHVDRPGDGLPCRRAA